MNFAVGNVEGSYTVALPDGRTQHVTYHVDPYSGFVANVHYEGKAHYDQAPSYHDPAPSYHDPAPPSDYYGWGTVEGPSINDGSKYNAKQF